MKRILISMLLIAALGAGTAVADPFSDFDAFTEGFQSFGEELAGALPHNTTIGQQWADAHIGQLLGFPPRFGLGVSFGVTTVPQAAFDSAFAQLGLESQDLLSQLPESMQGTGLPLPGYTIDARVGGIILPFDVGVKIGVLEDADLGDLELNYLLVGGDIRYRVLREGILLPKVSVGLGVNYSSFRLGVPGVLGDDVEIANVPTGPSTSAELSFSDPNLFLEWETTVFDFTAQASKRLLIFQPFAGVGLSYSTSSVGGGVASQLLVDGTEWDDLSSTDRQQIQDALAASDQGEFNITGNEFGFLATQDGVFNTRVFGGLGLRLFMLNLDLGASYEFGSGSLGAQIGTRIQF
ncbi:MAG: hypothetical protein EA383_03095 [Spirochaetaceae bacterium]|nr:MAG: hypothetical protein EA383_03095 [Spirochaetaceae bacterium]